MNNLQSILGYGTNSPFRHNPYLDIETPEGLISMANTPIDILGIDELGNAKKMKAGRKKDYKFPGTKVREIPVGNPYQRGGLTKADLFGFLFDDDEEEVKNTPTAPSVDEVPITDTVTDTDDAENEALAMSMLQENRQSRGNPYGTRNPVSPIGNMYQGEILSSGQFGSQNVGNFGRQIYGELVSDLGYAPVANSIFRSKEQQDQLIAKGVGARNSYHLTGDAIDLKPKDWHRLTLEQQAKYKSQYDVVVHNGHYHLEPKG